MYPGTSVLMATALLFLVSCKKDSATDSPGETGKLGKIYWGFNANLSSYDLETGQLIWEKNGVYATQRNVPFYDSGVIYTSDVYGASAVNASSGDIVWTRNYSSHAYRNNNYSYECSGTMKDGLFYTMGWSGSSGDLDLYCIRKKTGEIVWQRNVARSGIRHVGMVSSPVISGTRVIVAGDDWNAKDLLICFDAQTGNQLWQTELQLFAINPSAYPQADEQNAYVTDHRVNKIHAFDLATGTKKWSVTLPFNADPIERPVIRGNFLVANSDRYSLSDYAHVYLINKQTGILDKIITVSNDESLSFWADNERVINQGAASIRSYSLADGSKNWETPKPIVKVFDSLANVGQLNNCYNWYFTRTVVAGNMILNFENYFCSFSPNCVYGEWIIVDKQTGKITKTVKDCRHVPEAFLYVQDSKAYYPNIGGN